MKLVLPTAIIGLLVYSLLDTLWITLSGQQFILATFILNLCLWLICFLLFRMGFLGKKEIYLKRFGKAAYRKAFFRFLLPYSIFWWGAASMPLWVPGERILRLIPFSILGAIFIALAGLFIIKTQVVFGMDYFAFTHFYFPQEAKLVTSKIFGFIRHPIYTAWIYLGIGFFLIRGSLTSLASAIVNITVICVLSEMEERDIIKYFKEDYRAYKNSVPPFFPKKPVAFLKFLLAKDKR